MIVWRLVALIVFVFLAALLRTQSTFRHARVMNQAIAETDPDQQRYHAKIGLVSELGFVLSLLVVSGLLISFGVDLIRYIAAR